MGSCHPSACSHPACPWAARLLSLQPKAFKFWEIKQQNKQNEQNQKKQEREGGGKEGGGHWGRWYWPITVGRFCAGTGKWRRWETAVTVPVALGVGTGSLSILPFLHPPFTILFTPHPAQSNPAPSAPQSQGGPPQPQLPPSTTGVA